MPASNLLSAWRELKNEAADCTRCARSLFGKVGKLRGEPYQLADGGECCVTVHPSSLMRTAPPS